MKHYSQLPQFSNLVQFNELSNELKLIAISEILHSEEIWFNLHKNEYLNSFKNSIHLSINNRSTYKSLLESSKKLKKLKQNFQYLEKYIIENNKLIAEFMGVNNLFLDSYYLPQFGHYCNNYGDIEFDETFSSDMLKYHSSWDWLMPVIKKCNEVDHFQAYTNFKPIIAMLGTLDILNTHSAVIDFIKWFNNH